MTGGLFSTLIGAATRNASDKPPGPTADFWYEGISNGSAAGIRVTPDIALKVAALYACVRVLAETIASLPLRMRRMTDVGAIDQPAHPLDEVIRYQPNRRQTAIEFWETVMFNAVLKGEGLAEIIPGQRGAVDQLEPIIPSSIVKRELLPDRSLRFLIQDPHTGVRRTLLQEEIFRVPGLSGDGITPMRAVDLAADDIGLGIAADQYAARVFSNRLNMGGFLVHPGSLSKEAQKNLIDRLTETFAGVKNSHRPMLLQEGLDFKAASMDASEAQLLEARKWQTILIAQRFRIPLQLLQIYDGATHSNVEQQSLDFVKYTLRPWVRRISQAIRRDLIVAKSIYFAEFNLDGLLEGDTAAQTSYFSAALSTNNHAPWMTVNEVRRKKNLPDVEGGDQMPAQQKSAPLVPTMSRDIPAIEDITPEGRAARLAKKENTAVRRACMRHAADPDALRSWIKAFYGGHVSTVMETLNVSNEAARAYCQFQRDETLQANDMASLIEHREHNLAGVIAKTLREHEQDEESHGQDAAS